MTIVRIAHAEPRPGKMPNGTVVVGQHLVVLTDTAPAEDTAPAKGTAPAKDTAPSAGGGHRALPIWLRVPGGRALWHLLDAADAARGPSPRPAPGPAPGTGMAGVLEETAARLLDAAGVRVTVVDIEPSGEDVTELNSGTVTARVALATAGPDREVVVSAGYGLALAAAAGAPVRVADEVMDRLAVPVQGDDLMAPFRPPAAIRPLGRPGQQRWRFEPRNLAFADGLDRWDLAGSFLAAGQPHWQDYSCTAQDGMAVLASTVPQPAGFAALVQTIYADDYRGAALTFRGELRATSVAGQAGLHLVAGRPGEPPGPHLRDRGHGSLIGRGSHDWTWHEVTLPVPGNAGLIRFGISLTGPGRVELRSAELTGQPPSPRQD